MDRALIARGLLNAARLLEAAETPYEQATDAYGTVLKPGMYVSFPTYPKGTWRGWVTVSKREMVRLDDGSLVKALGVVDEDGVEYNLTSKTKLMKKQLPVPSGVKVRKAADETAKLGKIIADCRAGKKSAIKALTKFFKIKQKPAELGYTYTVMASWFGRLSGQLKNKLSKEVVYYITRLNRLPSDKGLKALESLAKTLSPSVSKTKGGKPKTVMGMKVQAMGRVTAQQVDEACGALRKAAKLLKQKGFGQLLYGNVYVVTSLKGGKNLADYEPATDTIALSKRIDGSAESVRMVIHEFGHRLFHKFAKDIGAWTRGIYKDGKTVTVKDRQIAWSEFGLMLRNEMVERGLLPEDKKVMGVRKKLPKWHSNVNTAWTKHLHSIGADDSLRKLLQSKPESILDGSAEDVYVRAQDGDVEVKGAGGELISPTDYGKKDTDESYAETFSYYVTGKQLDEGLKELLEATLV